MADAWELICHHTYAGIPQVVPDLSPRAASHGRAWGLADSDFLTDGAAPGSGAVRFYNSGSLIHVPKSVIWQSIDGIKGEVTFRREQRPVEAAYTLIYSDAFHFYIRGANLVAWFRGEPLSYIEVSVSFDAVGSPPYAVPYGRWVTLGFMHDGLRTLELYADGQVIARRNGSFNAVAPVSGAGALSANGLTIGDTSPGGNFLNGEIDTVKIWRLDPRRFDCQFFSRPLDDAAAECWRRFLQALVDALRRHPDSARELYRRMKGVTDHLLRRAIGKGPETRERMFNLSQQYGQLWRSGQLDSPQMAKVFAELTACWQLAGISPESDPGFTALMESDCMDLILAELPLLECDPKVKALVNAIEQPMGSANLGAKGGMGDA
jgi:hypothetical protein